MKLAVMFVYGRIQKLLFKIKIIYTHKYIREIDKKTPPPKFNHSNSNQAAQQQPATSSKHFIIIIGFFSAHIIFVFVLLFFFGVRSVDARLARVYVIMNTLFIFL